MTTDRTVPDHSEDGDLPMTPDQAEMLQDLCLRAAEPFNGSLSEAQAMARIEELSKIVNRDENL